MEGECEQSDQHSYHEGQHETENDEREEKQEEEEEQQWRNSDSKLTQECRETDDDDRRGMGNRHNKHLSVKTS